MNNDLVKRLIVNLLGLLAVLDKSFFDGGAGGSGALLDAVVDDELHDVLEVLRPQALSLGLVNDRHEGNERILFGGCSVGRKNGLRSAHSVFRA